MRTFIIAAATLFSSTAFTQEPSQGTASIPDFSGIWGHPYVPAFEPPESGPAPVVNNSRRRQVFNVDGNLIAPGADAPVSSTTLQFIGDYTNPILKPQAAEGVKRFGETEMSGVAAPTPSGQCWPEPLPYIFWNLRMQLFQQPDRITIIYSEDHEVRHVRMNQLHPAQVTPSWYGDSVGHYEADALVIDTVGIRVDRPFAMVDMFGTPYSRLCMSWNAIGSSTTEPQGRPSNEPKRSFSTSRRRRPIPLTGAKGCSSRSPSRTRAPSRRLGPEPSPIDAPSGLRLSAPKTSTNIMLGEIQRSRAPRPRIFERQKGLRRGVSSALDTMRRIYTDKRDWPDNGEPSFQGYSIGQWVDEDGGGIYDVLEVETRNFKGPRFFRRGQHPPPHR